MGIAQISRALTALDDNLFAATRDNRLLCRDTVTVDLTWTEIGKTPEHVRALAAYYGLLFAATSSDELWYRPAICIPSPLYTGSLMFYNQLEGNVAIGPFSGNGDFETLQDYPQPDISFAKDWTHVVSANNGILLFYDNASGRCSTGKLEDDGTYKNLQDYPQPDISFAKDWTHVVSANNGLFFFYNDTNGSAQAGGMTISGIYEKLQAYLENTFNVGWTNIVSCTKR